MAAGFAGAPADVVGQGARGAESEPVLAREKGASGDASASSFVGASEAGGGGDGARPHEQSEAVSAAQHRIQILVDKTDQLLARKLGSPKRKPALRGRRFPRSGGRRQETEEQEEDKVLLEDEEADEVITHLSVPPPNLSTKHGVMRPYQLEGLNWLIGLHQNKLSGILADEMGLGKTLQSISLLAYLRHFRSVTGPHIVVVPLTTIGNWCREFGRWCPDIRVLKFHGDKDERARLVAEELRPDKFDVCVTSYEMVSKEKGKLRRISWYYMIVDEAHRLKNEHSQLSEVLRTLSSKYRLLLTGTPLQNNLHELWALLNFLLPETFDSSAEFDEVFNAEEKQIKDGILTMLHRILRPFMLRRLKSDVEKALPPKIETLVFVGMSQKQKELYLSVLNKDHDAVLGNTKEKARLLNILMQLRKAANHPYLFDGVEDRSIPAHDCEHLIQMSGKVAVLDKLLAKLKAAGSRVLIFSQMTRMLDILEDYLIYRGYEYCRIDGNTGTQARDEAMEIFNAPNSPKFCFLLSTRSGGLGINLATADVVILFDSDWNPQMDLQAQDRAHRIGQKKQVRVYRLITESTVEEKIIERAEIKLRLDALVIQQGRLSSKSQKLNQKDVQEMIQYGADKIFRSKESAITDEDIDLILSRGEAKTVEFNDKLQKHVGLLSLGSQGAGSAAGAGGSGGLSAGSGGVGLVLDGSDNGPLLPVDENARERKFDLLLKISEAIPKQRERKKRLNYSTEDYFRAAMSAAKPVRTNVLKVPRLPKMLDFQFYNEARLRELYEKEREFYETYQDDPDPPATSGLTKEEQDERDKLEAEAYGEWNRRHYQAYIRACERFGRDNIEKISQNVMGKTAQEVIAYHKVFWSRYKQLRGWERIIRSIERSELRKERNKAVEQLIAKKLSKYPNLEVAMTRVSFKYNTKNNPAAKGYTPENDAFFLCGVSREGYGEWDAMRQAIRDTPELRFDYFMQSRSALEVHRRVDTLVRILEKEAEEDAAAAEEKKGGDAAASGMGPSATVGAAAASAVGSAMGAKGKAAGGKKPAAAARRAGKRPPEASAPPKSPRSPKRPKLATTPAGGGGAEQAQGQDANAERNYSDSVSHSLALESGSHS